MNKETGVRARQALATKKKITSKAIELFERFNYDEVSVRDICSKSNVSVGTFYHYFESKEAIFCELHQEQSEELNKFYFDEISTLPPRARILQLAEKYAKDVADAGVQVMQILYDPKINLGQNQNALKELYKHAITEAKDAGQIQDKSTTYEIVSHLLLISQGVVYDWCRCDGSYDLTKHLQRHLTYALTAFF